MPSVNNAGRLFSTDSLADLEPTAVPGLRPFQLDHSTERVHVAMLVALLVALLECLCVQPPTRERTGRLTQRSGGASRRVPALSRGPSSGRLRRVLARSIEQCPVCLAPGYLALRPLSPWSGHPLHLPRRECTRRRPNSPSPRQLRATPAEG
jgi:hypothetical protein